MISEKKFIRTHHHFWNQLLPMVEYYVRRQNAGLHRLAAPLLSQLPAHTRALVNEIGFRLFSCSMELSIPLQPLPSDTVLREVDAAVESIARLKGSEEMSRPGRDEISEANVLRERLVQFFAAEGASKIHPYPEFAGCGWLDSCQGDVISDKTLCEIKSGNRRFRSTDIRQLICYCALNFASDGYEIDKIALINPRMGLVLTDDLDQLCTETAGMSAVNALSEVVEYMSEPADRYQHR